MKVFDVVGTTVYPNRNLSEIEMAERDCERVVLPSIFIDMHMIVGQCELADDPCLYENGLPIDWIVTVMADDAQEIDRAVPHANEAGKQYSYLYEVNDVTDEVGGAETFLQCLNGRNQMKGV